MEYFKLKAAGLPTSFRGGDEPIVRIEESAGRITISYIFPGFSVSDAAGKVSGERLTFKQVNIKKTGSLTQSGKPLLPSFGRYVQIPFNMSYKWEVRMGEPAIFGDMLILPAQENITDDPQQVHEFEYDRGFYAADALFPQNMAEVTGPFIIDGYNAVLVHVRPLQYNPAKKEIIGYGNIAVNINITAARDAQDQPAFDPSRDRAAFGNLFVNPGRGIDERMGFGTGMRSLSSILRGKYEYLILYNDSFRDAAQRLAEWKDRRGLPTQAVPISTVGNSVGQIKNYLRERMGQSSKLGYVLLFGDTDSITPETTDESGPWGSNITDYYYAARNDPANPDDCVPANLSIGRIPVQNPAHAQDIVDQIISYEKNPPADPEYYRRMVFTAYFQDDPPQDGIDARGYMKTLEDIRAHMIMLGFNVERIYVSNNPNPQTHIDGAPVSDDTKKAITDGGMATNTLISRTREGQLVIAHRDHGGPGGWSHPAFNTNHLDQAGGINPTMFFSINCLTGMFDTNPSESFAEKVLRMRGGAPSLIAATRQSHTWLNNDLIKAIFDALWPGVLPSFPGTTASYPVRYRRIGDILNYAKSYLPIKRSGSPRYIRDHFEIYHVIGDPTLEVWSAMPQIVDVSAKVSGNDLYIVLSTCPNGCRITLWHRGNLFKTLEPSSTQIKIPLQEIVLFGEREITVCFWAPGCRYREIRIML